MTSIRPPDPEEDLDCQECGREMQDCACPSIPDEFFNPLDEDLYDPDFDDYDPGEVYDDNSNSALP